MAVLTDELSAPHSASVSDGETLGKRRDALAAGIEAASKKFAERTGFTPTQHTQYTRLTPDLRAMVDSPRKGSLVASPNHTVEKRLNVARAIHGARERLAAAEYNEKPADISR